MTTLPWLTYSRVSTETQAREGVSMDAQDEATLAMAKALRRTVAESIRDPGVSAKDLDRPGITRALGLLRSGKFAGIIIYKLDRLSRSRRDVEDLMIESLRDGWSIVSVSENLDTSTPFGRFFVAMLANIAQLSRENTADLVRTSMRYRKAQGGFVGGRPPAGLRAEGEKGKRVLVRDGERADVVAEVWQRIIAGSTLRNVGDWLTERKVPSTAQRWTAKGVLDLARNERYIGHLVDRATFDSAGAVLSARHAPGKSISHGRTMSRTQTHAMRVWPLSGIARCGKCDSAMVGVHARNGSGTAFPYYRCGGRVRKGREFCSAKDLPAEVWESLVVRTLLEAIEDNGDLLPTIERASAELEAKAVPLTNELKILGRERDGLRQKLANLAAMAADGGPAARGLSGFIGEAQEAVEALDVRMAGIEGQLSGTTIGVGVAEALVDIIREKLRELPESDPERQAEILKQFLAYVRLRPPEAGKAEGEVDLAINLPRMPASSYETGPLVEIRRFELLTCSLRTNRSTN